MFSGHALAPLDEPPQKWSCTEVREAPEADDDMDQGDPDDAVAAPPPRSRTPTGAGTRRSPHEPRVSDGMFLRALPAARANLDVWFVHGFGESGLWGLSRRPR